MRNKWLTGLSGALVVAGILSTVGIARLEADEDEHERGEYHEYGEYGERGKYYSRRGGGRLRAELDPQYTEECGACHFAYPPQFLPARSWRKLMDGLADHFGENAELDPAVREQLTAYVSANAAETSNAMVSRKLMRGVEADAEPLRISELPYFVKEHREIPARMIADNPEVKSLSHCAKCHQDAAQGNFDEHGVRIPGFGRWED